jgi:outer membrane receptor protein involved in Fe transport
VSEVLVTATKRPATLASLPAGVSAIPGSQIQTTDATDVGRTVGQLAGVMTTNLGPGRDKLLIRGLSDGAFTGRARSTVSTYLDQAPINYNAPDPDLRLVDVERVEVVRGPQGALYGSASMAGIYRIVTNKPNLETLEAGLMGSLATTKGGDNSYEYEGYASIPLLPGRIAVRAVGYEDRQGGYIDDLNLRQANVDETRRNGGRIAVRVLLSDNWRIDALAATQHLRSNDTQYITPDALSGPMARRVREAHNNDFAYGGGAIQGDFGWGSVSSSTAYVHHVYSSQYDASATLFGPTPVFSDRTEDLGVYSERTRANMLVQDLVVRSSGAGPLDWLLGAYGSRTIERSPSELGLLAGRAVVTAYTEARKDRLTELAVYGEATYDFAPGWSVTFGGRYFQTRVRTTADIFAIAPYDTRTFDAARTFNGFSPKLSLQREFANGDLVYALVTEGYRPGGFNTSGLYDPRRGLRPTFRPDRLRNYEIGIKIRRFENRLSLRAAAYYDDWVHIQTDQYRPSGLAFTGNVGDARVLGLEGELTYDFPFGLSVQMNGLISDSEIRNPNLDFATKVNGALPGVPKVSGGLLAVYERPLSGALTLRLVGETSYVGRSPLSFDVDAVNRPLKPRIDGYLRARLSAEVATDRWRVTAFVSNPFDDAGDTFAYGNPFTFGLVRQVTPQRPRTVGVRLGATF